MSLQTMTAARNILKNLRRVYDERPRARVLVNEQDFSHLDLAAYGRFRQDMEGRGYRMLGDYEVVDLNRSSPMSRTFLRTMISPDGTVVCTYCQMKARPVRRAWTLFNDLMDGRGKRAWASFRTDIAIHHSTSVSTDFQDGGSVVVGNGEGGGQFTDQPGIEAHYFPDGTPLDTLLQMLGERVSWRRTEHPDVQPVTLSSIEELFELQDRAVAQKLAYRKSVGWITRDELLAIAQGNEEFADGVYEEIQKQLAREAERSQG